MYNVARNNFYDNEKNSTIYTPGSVSDFLFSILHDKIDRNGIVIDPCVGAGSLLWPFKKAGFSTVGIDVEDQSYPETVIQNFLSMKENTFGQPSLIIANPPFNIDSKTKELAIKIGGGRPLLPEVWLQHALKLWGMDVPICLFAPYGMRLNQTVKSRRWLKFLNGEYPPISSIIALPKDVYKNVLFHSEILVFNVEGLKPHYFFNG